MALSVIILAAGKGTRMKSDLPKVLHTLANKPIVEHIIDTVKSIECVNDNDDVLILVGDAPLISKQTLEELVRVKQSCDLALLTVNLDDPTGMGRIIRDPSSNNISEIVEHKDATSEQLNIQEINTGMMIMSGADLKRWLSALSNDNAQSEYYLTDVIAMAASEGKRIQSAQPQWQQEVEGINNRKQLAALECAYQHRLADKLMEAGVHIYDPYRIDIRGELTCGKDVSIDINAV